MSLATLKEVLEIAERTNTAIPGFNIDNIEIPEAIMEAAEVENCPVILTIGQGAINAGGLRHLPDVVRRIAESSSVPVVMHLDHSESYEQVIACLRAGLPLSCTTVPTTLCGKCPGEPGGGTCRSRRGRVCGMRAGRHLRCGGRDFPQQHKSGGPR